MTEKRLTYKGWMRAIDKILWTKVGLTTADLADFNSYDYWRDGLSPEDAAYEALENDTMGSWALLDLE